MDQRSLYIVIPALNEKGSVGEVIGSIPRKIDGVSKVTVIVIDDGSTDATVQVARNAGADIIHSFGKNRGLANAFSKGIELALKGKADIIVTMDADGQYDPREIPSVIKPILDKKAEVVLTDRQVLTLRHMPLQKRIGNVIATWVLRKACKFPVLDGQSGFRAFNREAARMLNIQSDYTYVAESIIQLSSRGLNITQTPCTFNPRQDKSRLINNIFYYAYRAGTTIIRAHLRYRALKTFVTYGLILITLGVALILRFLTYYVKGEGQGHVQSMILAAILTLIGFQLVILGLIADLINSNNRLLEDINYKLRE